MRGVGGQYDEACIALIGNGCARVKARERTRARGGLADLGGKVSGGGGGGGNGDDDKGMRVGHSKAVCPVECRVNLQMMTLTKQVMHQVTRHTSHVTRRASRIATPPIALTHHHLLQPLPPLQNPLAAAAAAAAAPPYAHRYSTQS